MTSAIEHPSVLQPLRHLARQGWALTELPVDAAGRVQVDHAANAITPEVALVSVMLANNETGSLQAVRALADLAHAAGALMHVDAAQAVGKVAVDVNALGADLLTLAGHKFYAPKGVGALYVRTGVALEPIQFGAGHERGLRPGTENVPHIVALGEAARLARTTLAHEAARMTALRDRLHGLLAAAIPGLQLNGHPTERLPNTLNVSFPAVAGWQVLAAAPSVAASTGSACHAGDHAVSGVLAAMGLTREAAAGAVRLSLGRFTTETEIDSGGRGIDRRLEIAHGMNPADYDAWYAHPARALDRRNRIPRWRRACSAGTAGRQPARRRLRHRLVQPPRRRRRSRRHRTRPQCRLAGLRARAQQPGLELGGRRCARAAVCRRQLRSRAVDRRALFCG